MRNLRFPQWVHDWWNVLNREFVRFSGNRVYLFIALAGPLLSFFLVMNIFLAGNPSDLPLAVVDLDDSQMSRQVIRMIDATRSVSVSSRPASLHDGNEAMLKGQVYAVLYIPYDFSKSVLKGEGSELVMYVNNSNVLNGGLIQSAVIKAVSTYSTGVKLQVAMKGGMAQEQALQQVYPLRLDTHELFNPYINYSYFLSSTLMPLLIAVFTLLGAVYVIGIELREGTAGEWIKTAGGSMWVALGGKLAPYTLLMCVNVAVMHFILVQHLGFPIKGSWAAIMAAELFMILAYQMVAVFLLAVTANTRLSLSLASGYSMIAFSYSGLTYPIAGMPMLAKIAANIFPYYHWMKVFLGQSLRNEPLSNASGPFLGLLTFILIGILLFPRLKYLLTEPRFYNRI